ncbi:hypothetical protein FC093_09440 [Ilyomonas limi]|uniref:Uncharacterized protein n=1 Tax=Ilyomonas limi TaxID=2575867 RepID=A0A4V5UUH1_9BACT|nr:hypothetical protein FC093_09440 [Ilyomonas limi]
MSFIYSKSFKNAAERYFNPSSCLYHYLHMAQENYKAYLKKEFVRLKKVFVCIRSFTCLRMDNAHKYNGTNGIGYNS